MKKTLALLLVLVLLISCFAACGSKDEPATQTAQPQANADSTQNSTQTPPPTDDTNVSTKPSGPVVITDMLGREVELPADIQRIAGLSSASRFITYAGASDYLVGMSALEISGDPGIPFAYVNKDKFASCTAISNGGSGDEFYTEEIVVLNPDLIFIYTADAAKADELQTQLGIPVVAFTAKDFLDPNFQTALRLIGTVMGTEDHANAVCDAIQGWIDDLNNRTKDIPEEEKPTVYTGAVGFRGPHGFEGTYGLYPPFVAINAHNVVDETEAGGAMLIDLEKVTVWDPDIIFLNPSSMYLVNEDYGTNPGFYENLTAVQEGRLYTQVSFNYFSTNMELAIADAYYAGCIVFPEQFADVDFNAKAEEIFNTMIGGDYLSVLDANGIGFGTLTIGE